MGWWILPAIVGIGTAAQIEQGRQASKRSKRAAALQQRIADVKAQRERTKLIAEARRKRALLAQQAEVSGVSESSGAVAGQSGITSQVASGVSFLDTVQRLGTQANIFTQRAADAQSKASAWGAIASVAGTAATARGDWKKLGSNLFPESGVEIN